MGRLCACPDRCHHSAQSREKHIGTWLAAVYNVVQVTSQFESSMCQKLFLCADWGCHLLMDGRAQRGWQASETGLELRPPWKATLCRSLSLAGHESNKCSEHHRYDTCNCCMPATFQLIVEALVVPVQVKFAIAMSSTDKSMRATLMYGRQLPAPALPNAAILATTSSQHQSQSQQHMRCKGSSATPAAAPWLRPELDAATCC